MSIEQGTEIQRRYVDRVLPILASACLLIWPAIWNRFPLVYPDSLQYFWDGKVIVGHLLRLHRPELVDARSEIYSVFAYAFYHSFGVWSAAVLQALLTSWVLWLVVRSVVRRRQVGVFLAVSAVLSFLTTASWFVSFLMPDIFGPLLYLGLYLLVFAPESLRRWEKGLLLGVCFFGITAHATHLLVAVWICFVLGVFWLCGWLGMRQRGVWLARVVALLLLAVGTQVAVHALLYREPSIFGRPLPFLTGRLLGDGPARTYLQEHCDEHDWVLCGHLDKLPENENDLFWNPNGVWNSLTPAQRRLMRRQQTPLLMAVLSTYPREQMRRSWSNFVAMMGHVGVDYDFNNYLVRDPSLDPMIWNVYDGYFRSRQHQNAMPWFLFRGIHVKVMIAALVALVLLMPLAWKRRHDLTCLRLLGLGVIVVAVLPANAFLGGVISCDDPRLQGRVAWLLTLLAALVAAALFDNKGSEEPSARG